MQFIHFSRQNVFFLLIFVLLLYFVEPVSSAASYFLFISFYKNKQNKFILLSIHNIVALCVDIKKIFTKMCCLYRGSGGGGDGGDGHGKMKSNNNKRIILLCSMLKNIPLNEYYSEKC